MYICYDIIKAKNELNFGPNGMVFIVMLLAGVGFSMSG